MFPIEYCGDGVPERIRALPSKKRGTGGSSWPARRRLLA